MKAWKAWNIKPWKFMESIEGMGIYKNESMKSMVSMVFSSILLLITSRKHGKHGKHGKKAWKAWESMVFIQMNLHPSGSLVFLACTSTLVTWLALSPWEASHLNAP